LGYFVFTILKKIRNEVHWNKVAAKKKSTIDEKCANLKEILAKEGYKPSFENTKLILNSTVSDLLK